MATDLASRTEDVMLTRFWGGQDRGVCVQVTPTKFKHVSLTRKQAAKLAQDLMLFAAGMETEEREV